MTWRRALIAAIAIGLSLMLATAGFEVATYLKLEGQATQLAAQQTQANMNRRQLAAAAHTSAVSQKASTHTRVTTVAQRCDLTEWIWQMSLRVDPILSQDLYYSLLGCQGQLNAVKAIDAATPTPKPAKRPAR